MVPSTERSGRAPWGSGPVSSTSTVTVPVLDRGIDARDLAGNDAVVGVDLGGLADLDVAGLGLGDLERGFELVRLHDLGEGGADG